MIHNSIIYRQSVSLSIQVKSANEDAYQVFPYQASNQTCIKECIEDFMLITKIKQR